MRQLFKLTTATLVMLFIGAIAFSSPQPVAAQAAVSWGGLFFSNANFSGTSQVGIYPSGLNVNWGAGAPTNPQTGQPYAGIPADGWSARFTATTSIAAGVYEFIVTGDGGVRLTINGEAVIDDLAGTGLSARSAIVNIEGGQYDLVVEYVDYTGNALIQVNWFISTGTPTGEATPPPANVVTVVTVNGLAVRTGPFLGGSLVAVARPGGDYPVIARNTQEGLFTWYLIQYDVDTQGWASGRYLTFVTGASDNVPLQDTTRFDDVIDPPGTVIGVTRSVMNFRQYPSVRSPRIPQVPQLIWGAEVEILARTVQGGNNFWYQVRYNEGDTTYIGWIFAPYVGIQAGSDPLDSVPII